MTWFARSSSLRNKRRVDTIGSCVGLFVLGPLAGLAGRRIQRKTGLSVLLTQQRPGLDGQPFDLYKIRTMTSDGVVAGKTAALARQLGLDEVPQLLNVLVGDMSLVGPRPLLIDPKRFGPSHPRYQLPPGLTGLAQVSGRERLTLRERAQLDAQYVRERSGWGDLLILAKTPLALATMPSDVFGRGLGRADDLGGEGVH